jgi:peroxiredoxin
MAANAPVCDFGAPAPDFELAATDGTRWTLQDVRGPNGALIVFICNHCPYVKAVADKLAFEGRELAALGIGMAAICSNDAEAYPADSPERMKDFAEAHGFPFPYLHDAEQSVARAYGAVCTPDFFGYNAGLALQYRGRLDDSGTQAKPDAERELYHAMKQIAESGKGPVAQVPSIGCSIKWRGT